VAEIARRVTSTPRAGGRGAALLEDPVARALKNQNLWLAVAYVALLLLMARVYV
jgi:hypothetical protein